MNIINMRSLIILLLMAGLLSAVTSKPSPGKTFYMKMNAGIITDKLAETRHFYAHVLAFRIQFESDWFLLMQTPIGGDQVSFLQADHSSQAELFQKSYRGEGMYLTIEVANADEEYERIRGLKIPVVVDLRDEPWGDRHFVIRDPNGIGIDIVTRSDAAR
jgi:catechol 2,3-dioxygenase-like lactoylglutathione lyase family enzyme